MALHRLQKLQGGLYLDSELLTQKITKRFSYYCFLVTTIMYLASCILLMLNKGVVVIAYLLIFVVLMFVPFWRGGIWRRLIAYSYLSSLMLTLLTIMLRL